MNSPSDRPQTEPDGIESASNIYKQEYFDAITATVVNEVWQTLDVSKLTREDFTDEHVICCGEQSDEDMIGCECRSQCARGGLFHYACVGVDPDKIQSPWYCSTEYQNQQIVPYQYCNCRIDLGTNEAMIGCAAEAICT
ncbi:hypothetical protein DPMN_038492 [Dreissena polymorpha]|uniref:Uncharacterized protein n=1 Tax=Dreissena polymorpha TaxID=45954 RepID=A0A9D4MGF3_DREPO|nr:hypothetical protein DPMN_038492 [Dreissena polymorpha]